MALVGAMALAVVVWAIVTTFSSAVPVPAAEYQECLQAAQQHGQKHQNCQAAETYWELTRSDPVALFTLWLAALTALLALASLFQGLLIIDQIQLGRDEFNATHRPKIRVRKIAVNGKWATGNASCMLINVGDAWGEVFEYDWEIVAGGLGAVKYPLEYPSGNIKYPPDPIYAANPTSEYVPGQERPLNMTLNSPPPLSTGQRPCVYGYVRFRDRAGIERRTGFMREYDQASGRFIVTADSCDADYEYED